MATRSSHANAYSPITPPSRSIAITTSSNDETPGKRVRADLFASGTSVQVAEQFLDRQLDAGDDSRDQEAGAKHPRRPKALAVTRENRNLTAARIDKPVLIDTTALVDFLFLDSVAPCG